MPQTALAILALALASTFALNQRELTTQAQLNMIRNEIGVVATGIAAEVFDHIGSMPFDKNGAVSAPLELTPPSEFGAAEDWKQAGSVDAFHDHSTVFSVESDYGFIDVEVTAAVTYVQKVGESFLPTVSPQYLKQVTLELEGPLGYRAEVTRVFSYFD